MRQVKRRSKEYKPKAVHVPMMKETRDELALRLYAAIETLIADPDPVSYNALSVMLCTLKQAGAQGYALDDANSAMLDICNRYERVNRVGVSDGEEKLLRRAAGGLDALIGTIPVNQFKLASMRTKRWAEEMGAA